MRILSFFRKNILLFLIIAAGIFFRLYNFKELFMYSHDQDLSLWIIRDILVNHHPRLIGQLTSNPGVFIGPLYYYLLIPFYLLFRGDPIGGIFLSLSIGVFAIWSTYFVFSKIFDTKTGLISALFYAVSPYTVFNDREVVPTVLLIPWSIWFFYSLNLILKGDQKKGFLFIAILTALIWHVNLGLVILLPLYLFAFLMSKRSIDFKALLTGLVFFVILSSPLILFETRHGFSQTKAILFTASQSGQGVVSGVGKLGKVYDIVIKDVAGIIWGSPNGVPKSLAFWLVTISSLILFARKKIEKKIFTIILLWFLLTAVFFALYSHPISEYYLNSLTILWIALVSVIFAHLFSSNKFKYLGIILFLAFLGMSIYRFAAYPINKEGYIERKEVIDYIKTDAASHNFPCVAISYITDPGFDLGYRYLILMDNLKIRPVSTFAPVYTIVFPLSKVSVFDKRFGVIGVINPDYSRYNKAGIEKSCQGDNFNLTGPLFGYTQ